MPVTETSTIEITLPDGSKKEVPKGTTAYEIAKAISPRLADAALAAKIKSRVTSRETLADAVNRARPEGEAGQPVTVELSGGRVTIWLRAVHSGSGVE